MQSHKIRGSKASSKFSINLLLIRLSILNIRLNFRDILGASPEIFFLRPGREIEREAKFSIARLNDGSVLVRCL